MQVRMGSAKAIPGCPEGAIAFFSDRLQFFIFIRSFMPKDEYDQRLDAAEKELGFFQKIKFKRIMAAHVPRDVYENPVYRTGHALYALLDFYGVEDKDQWLRDS